MRDGIHFLAHLETRKHFGRAQYRITALWEVSNAPDAVLSLETLWGDSKAEALDAANALLVVLGARDLAVEIEAMINVNESDPRRS